MFDPECERLALHFLPEQWFPARERFASELAQQIQDAIEAWFSEHDIEVERHAVLASAPRQDLA